MFLLARAAAADDRAKFKGTTTIIALSRASRRLKVARIFVYSLFPVRCTRPLTRLFFARP